MKKTILTLILVLFSLTMQSQTFYIDTIKPFVCGVDSLPNLYYKILPYRYKEYKENYKNINLTEILVDNYIYNGMIGTLELFIGNNKLYYIKFYFNDLNYLYYSYDKTLFKKYIIYWDEGEENSKWFFDKMKN